MKKMILVWIAGIMVFLVVGSLAIAQAPEEKLQTEVNLLREIVGDQSVVLEEAKRKIDRLQREKNQIQEEMKATRTKFEDKVSGLENVNLWYWQSLILALLIIVILAVVLGVAIKAEVISTKKLRKINTRIHNLP